jgi:DNA-binding PadR family transcriptional regulator
MTNPTDDISDLIPLREPTFFILLSLAEGEKHGYAIMRDVSAISQERVSLSTGTLYEALARLLDQALIERVMAASDLAQAESHPGRPRKAYRLTARGERVVAAELTRLQMLVSVAQRQLSGATGS